MRSVLSLILLAVMTMVAAGCATSRDVRRADGWMTHVVSCGGPLLNMGHCLEKAGDVCGGRGYDVLNKVGGELPDSPNAMPTGGLPDFGQAMENMKDYPERKLYIKCR